MDRLPTELVALVGTFCDVQSLRRLAQVNTLARALFMKRVWRTLRLLPCKYSCESQDCVEVDYTMMAQFANCVDQGHLDQALEFVVELQVLDSDRVYRGVGDDSSDSDGTCSLSTLFSALSHRLDLLSNFKSLIVDRTLSPRIPATFDNPTALESFAATLITTTTTSTTTAGPIATISCTLNLADNRSRMPRHDSVLNASIRHLEFSMNKPRTAKNSHLESFIDSQLPPNLYSATLFLPGMSRGFEDALSSSSLKQLNVKVHTSMKARNQLNWIPESVEKLKIQVCSASGRGRHVQDPVVVRVLPNVEQLELDIGCTDLESLASLRFPSCKKTDVMVSYKKDTNTKALLGLCLSWCRD